MKKIIVLLSIIVIFLTISSCATLLGPKEHFVNFTSTPTKAKIYIDDKKMGVTPQKIALTPNKNYTVEYKKEGYEAISTQLTHRISSMYLGINLLISYPIPIPILIDLITGNWREFNQQEVHQTLEPDINTITKPIMVAKKSSENNIVTTKNQMNQKSNELKINLLLYSTVFNTQYRFYNIDYQRIISDTKSIGFSFGGRFKFNSTYEYSSDWISFPDIPDIAFLPYFRQYYFSKKRAAGAFTEMSGLINYYKYNYIVNGIDKGIQKSWGVGIGFAVGYKYISENNWVFELLIGGGINNLYLLHPRTGILIGKRF